MNWGFGEREGKSGDRRGVEEEDKEKGKRKRTSDSFLLRGDGGSRGVLERRSKHKMTALFTVCFGPRKKRAGNLAAVFRSE